jgi:hypothetical protein
MKKLVSTSVLAALGAIAAYSPAVPGSATALAAPIQTPTPTCSAGDAPNQNVDNQCLAVSEDVNWAIAVATPPTGNYAQGCNQHTWDEYGADCNHDFPDRLYMISNHVEPYCQGRVCGEYYYTMYEHTPTSNNSGNRRPVEIGSLRPELKTAFQTWGATGVSGGVYGFGCFLLAATKDDGDFRLYANNNTETTETGAGTKRFVEYCFTQWKTGGGFPADYTGTGWLRNDLPGRNATGSLLSVDYGRPLEADEAGVSSVTGVCAGVQQINATVDTVHITYGSVETNLWSAYQTIDFRINSLYLNRVLEGCGRGELHADKMRVVGVKTGFEGSGFYAASARHTLLGVGFEEQ